MEKIIKKLNKQRRVLFAMWKAAQRTFDNGSLSWQNSREGYGLQYEIKDFETKIKDLKTSINELKKVKL